MSPMETLVGFPVKYVYDYCLRIDANHLILHLVLPSETIC
jgi:hypothetical protein